MQVYVSEELKQSFSEVKEKQIISIKEFLKLQTKISTDQKWIVYVGYFMDILMTVGISLFINFITSINKINLSFFAIFIITEVIFRLHKLFWRISSLNDLFKVLKKDGIKISEIENLKVLKSNHSFQSYKLLKITNLFYSDKTQKEVFHPIVADWQEEYFKALYKKEIWKALWINVRYTYAFLAAMWLKSPIGDLIEFVIKIAKQ